MKKIIIGLSLLGSISAFAGVKYNCAVANGETNSDSSLSTYNTKKVVVELNGKLASIGSTFVKIESDLATAMEVNNPKIQVKLTVSDLIAGSNDPVLPGQASSDTKEVTMLNSYTVGSVDQKILIAGFKHQPDSDGQNFIEVICTKL